MSALRLSPSVSLVMIIFKCAFDGARKSSHWSPLDHESNGIRDGGREKQVEGSS